jgi:hypothetical protein
MLFDKPVIAWRGTKRRVTITMCNVESSNSVSEEVFLPAFTCLQDPA